MNSYSVYSFSAVTSILFMFMGQIRDRKAKFFMQ